MQDEKIIFLRSDDLLGRKKRSSQTIGSSYDQFSSKAKSLAFGDLKPNDLIVHVKHGVGVYEGLKIITIDGIRDIQFQFRWKLVTSRVISG